MSNKKRFNDKPVIVVLCLLFIYPLGAIFLWTGEAFSKAVKIGLTVGFGLLFFAAVSSSKSGQTKTDENGITNGIVDISGEVDMTTQEDITKAANKEIFKDQFSPFDGSHINFEYDLKNSLKDPDSYEHIETKVVEFSEDMQFMTINTKYRARNSFGGMVIEYKKAKIDLDGNTIEIYE